jgi:hypothetical protein
MAPYTLAMLLAVISHQTFKLVLSAPEEIEY